ncbi:MAG: type II toxin-antitoxin system RelE/ParE family toxin [bacterium]
MYKIYLTQRALKDLKGIEIDIQERIARKLKECAAEPFKFARKLINPKIGTFRLRVGDYRVIFDIEGEDIVVLRIGHRRDIDE